MRFIVQLDKGGGATLEYSNLDSSVYAVLTYLLTYLGISLSTSWGGCHL